jgi:hypothetical protein
MITFRIIAFVMYSIVYVVDHVPREKIDESIETCLHSFYSIYNVYECRLLKSNRYECVRVSYSMCIMYSIE